LTSYDFTDTLCRQVVERLSAFPRQAAPGDGLRHAAVAIALMGNRRGEACFVMTLRRATLRSHAGQFALPGGRLEAGESPEDAARRELAEEIGLDVPSEAVLGCLDDYVSRSGHLITPVVVWGGAVPRLTPCTTEVEEIYEVPLAHLDRPGNPHLYRIPQSPRPVIYLSLLETTVFAPTAALLYQFSEVALHGRQTRVADFEQPTFAWR
jgi:8-oxo-dGTP pyrophosphatase MutT (NUDIX family)